jgi:hypothetical protein
MEKNIDKSCSRCQSRKCWRTKVTSTENTEKEQGESMPKKHTEAAKLYTFEVSLISGPLSEQFIEKNPVVSRTIAIRGDQTFEDFHQAIFEAFNREDPHMFEFQIGGKGPQDPNAKCYVSEVGNAEAAGHVGDTRIDAVGLDEEMAFGYWFDYGDDWWHQVSVLSMTEPIPKGRYPKITKRTGASPPQYPDE